MKETGMIRRLDDLGRLVIPKEIRKKYKMNEGDSIEIYLKDDNICIRKYDMTSPFFEQIYFMCQILNKNYRGNIFFTSDEYLKKMQIAIEEKICEKAKVHRSVFFENLKIYKEDEKRYNGYICPVSADGNYYGSFVFVFDDYLYTEDELRMIQMFRELLVCQQH